MSTNFLSIITLILTFGFSKIWTKLIRSTMEKGMRWFKFVKRIRAKGSNREQKRKPDKHGTLKNQCNLIIRKSFIKNQKLINNKK